MSGGVLGKTRAMARRTVQDMLADARARLDRVDPAAAARAAAERGALLLDIRSDRQREAVGVIPGAIHHPRNVLEWRADPDSGVSDPELAGDLDREVIVFCQAGYASSLVAVTLQEMGFSRVTDLDGGFEAWRDAGLPVAPEGPRGVD